MFLSQHRCAIGSFPNRIDVEYALNELNSAGFPMAQISIVAKDADRDAQLDGAGMSDFVGDTQEGTPIFAIAGSMLGAIGGCLVGLGILAVPLVGPIVAVGTSGTALTATLVGVGVGIVSGGLIEVLTDLGMTLDRARVDGDRFSTSEYLVMVDGTDDEVRRAESILCKSYSSKVWVCAHQ